MCDFLDEGFPLGRAVGGYGLIESTRNTDVLLDEFAEFPHAADVGRVPLFVFHVWAFSTYISVANFGTRPFSQGRKGCKVVRIAVIIEYIWRKF